MVEGKSEITSDGRADSSSGLGYAAEHVHVTYLGQLVNPIGGLVMLAALGAVLGGLDFIP
jgi:hypothetical protein